MIIKPGDIKAVSALFDGWEETLIYSCLEGTMGEIYSTHDGLSAMAMINDFCFLSGAPSGELAAFRAENRGGFIIMVPQNEGWAQIIKSVYGSRTAPHTRYATKKNTVFDTVRLRNLAAPPEGYRIEMIGRHIYEACLNDSWSRDLVSAFGSYEAFSAHGIGCAVLFGDTVVSGASSYSYSSGGIETEIDTRADFRRRGLALACGARLILECLDRGLYPSWDAQTLGSLSLAKKLGYEFSHEYPAYEIFDY